MFIIKNETIFALVTIKYYKMRKLFFFIVFCSVAIAASAQKIVDFQSAQARVLDVNTNAFVMPKVVELEMIKTVRSNADFRIDTVVHYSNEEVNAMKGDDLLANMRANASFKLCSEYGADVIVGALYEIRNNKDHTGMEVRVIGYPARFSKWRNIQDSDYKWIGLKSGTTDAEKTKAIVK